MPSAADKLTFVSMVLLWALGAVPLVVLSLLSISELIIGVSLAIAIGSVAGATVLLVRDSPGRAMLCACVPLFVVFALVGVVSIVN
ncbi:MAG: hypothetical protein MUE84_05495 [Hyphomonas sp.]|nr:hypothetical protein [Hyphomonas sp.]